MKQVFAELKIPYDILNMLVLAELIQLDTG